MAIQNMIKVQPSTSDDKLRRIAFINYSMTHLDLNGCYRITDLAIPIIKSLDKLVFVNVAGSGITLRGLRQLLDIKGLDVVFVDRFISMKDN